MPVLTCFTADRRYFLALLLTEGRSASFVAAMDTKLKRQLHCSNGFQVEDNRQANDCLDYISHVNKSLKVASLWNELPLQIRRGGGGVDVGWGRSRIRGMMKAASPEDVGECAHSRVQNVGDSSVPTAPRDNNVISALTWRLYGDASARPITLYNKYKCSKSNTLLLEISSYLINMRHLHNPFTVIYLVWQSTLSITDSLVRHRRNSYKITKNV
jgi:hypothetical protein